MRSIMLAALLLAGCSAVPTSTPMPEGQAVAPPEGWVGYCLRHPDDEGRCQPAADEEPAEPLARLTPA